MPLAGLDARVGDEDGDSSDEVLQRALRKAIESGDTDLVSIHTGSAAVGGREHAVKRRITNPRMSATRISTRPPCSTMYGANVHYIPSDLALL